MINYHFLSVTGSGDETVLNMYATYVYSYYVDNYGGDNHFTGLRYKKM